MKQQPTKKSKMHTIVEVSNAAEMGWDEINKGREHVRGEGLDRQNEQETHEGSESIEEFWERAMRMLQTAECKDRPRVAPGGKDERTEKVAKWIQEELRYRGGELDRGLGGEAGRAGSLEVCSGPCESVTDAPQKVLRHEDQEIRASTSGLVYASATV